MLKKFLCIGDFNLKGINWDTGNSSNSLENEFINGFADLGLLQCKESATHNKGNILDIFLTKSKQYITDLKIIDTERYCISDNYAITFKISHNAIRKPRTKRDCYDYKNTRGDSLNKDLNDVNWDNLLDYQEPETAWSNFKKALFEHINKHVPKFTIKSEFQPPWFDSECYSKCKEKDKLHKIYKKKKTLASEIRFKTARRDFKSLMKSKMRANFDTENRNMLTKKFCFHIKTKNKSTRIPEVVSCGAIATSDPTTKANLFNDYFRKQFSEPSSYDIDINFQNNCNFDVDLSFCRIKSILNNLDINKAQGPDNINGTVLKHCSE